MRGVYTTLRAFGTEERGQALPVIALMMVALLAITGVGVDAGRALFLYRQLQAATDAAAMAGASQLPSSTAAATATQFSAVSGSQNARTSLVGATMVSGYPLVKCLKTLQSQGMACVSPGNGNAVQVKEQITMNLVFLRVIGMKTATIAASATASMRGSSSSPYNVAVVLDTTASMNDYDSDSNCSSTRLACAMQGVQTLLRGLTPCASSLATCGPADSSGNVSSPVDRVSLYVFPGLTSASQTQNDTNCSGVNPTTSAYTYPVTAVYQITPYQSNYRSSDTSTSLAGSSSIVDAVGGKSNCPGMQAPGGQNTYYAGILYAVQADLAAQAAANPGTQNVLVFLSDGDANAPYSGTKGAKGLSGNYSTTSGTYPSSIDQCQQAIVAAQAATAAGTHVYSVAYGAAASGCSTDTSGPLAGLTPCQTMQKIASASQYFFSDYTASAGSGTCISASQPASSLTGIFSQIAGDLTVGRLIPDNTP